LEHSDHNPNNLNEFIIKKKPILEFLILNSFEAFESLCPSFFFDFFDFFDFMIIKIFQRGDSVKQSIQEYKIK